MRIQRTNQRNPASDKRQIGSMLKWFNSRCSGYPQKSGQIIQALEVLWGNHEPYHGTFIAAAFKDCFRRPDSSSALGTATDPARGSEVMSAVSGEYQGQAIKQRIVHGTKGIEVNVSLTSPCCACHFLGTSLILKTSHK